MELLGIAGIILGIIGSLIAICSVCKKILEKKSKKRLSWRKYTKNIDMIIREMRTQEYYPDFIIGMGRGGAFIAAYLSGNLLPKKLKGGNEHIPFVVCDRRYFVDDNADDSLEESVSLIGLPSLDFHNKKILFTILAANTGKTIGTLKREILRDSGKHKPSIKIYAMYNLGSLIKSTDFFNERIAELPIMPYMGIDYDRDSHTPSKH